MRLLERCLERNVKNRLRDIGEARVAIEATLAESGSLAAPPARAKPGKRPWLWAAAAGATLLLAAVVVWRLRMGPPASSSSLIENVQITQLTSTGTALNPAISPDGKYVAYVQREGSSNSLWMRQIDTTSQMQIVPPEPGTYIGGVTVTPDGGFVDFCAG